MELGESSYSVDARHKHAYQINMFAFNNFNSE